LNDVFAFAKKTPQPYLNGNAYYSIHHLELLILSMVKT